MSQSLLSASSCLSRLICPPQTRKISREITRKSGVKSITNQMKTLSVLRNTSAADSLAAPALEPQPAPLPPAVQRNGQYWPNKSHMKSQNKSGTDPSNTNTPPVSHGRTGNNRCKALQSWCKALWSGCAMGVSLVECRMERGCEASCEVHARRVQM